MSSPARMGCSTCRTRSLPKISIISWKPWWPGGRLCLCSNALYDWTMPFGPLSRTWTSTGSGAWRYDYRNALIANAVFVERMQRLGETAMVRMLHARARQYVSMVHYIDAQRSALGRAPWRRPWSALPRIPLPMACSRAACMGAPVQALRRAPVGLPA